MRSDFSLNRVVTQASRVFCVCAIPVLCNYIKDIVQHTIVFFFPSYIFLFTQAPILVWFDSTIIDISAILVTMYYYSGYVGL